MRDPHSHIRRQAHTHREDDGDNERRNFTEQRVECKVKKSANKARESEMATCLESSSEDFVAWARCITDARERISAKERLMIWTNFLPLTNQVTFNSQRHWRIGNVVSPVCYSRDAFADVINASLDMHEPTRFSFLCRSSKMMIRLGFVSSMNIGREHGDMPARTRNCWRMVLDSCEHRTSIQTRKVRHQFASSVFVFLDVYALGDTRVVRCCSCWSPSFVTN